MRLVYMGNRYDKRVGSSLAIHFDLLPGPPTPDRVVAWSPERATTVEIDWVAWDTPLPRSAEKRPSSRWRVGRETPLSNLGLVGLLGGHERLRPICRAAPNSGQEPGRVRHVGATARGAFLHHFVRFAKHAQGPALHPQLGHRRQHHRPGRRPTADNRVTYYPLAALHFDHPPLAFPRQER